VAWSTEYAREAASSTTPYAATGIGGKWFSLIQAVATGMSDSQNRRCWLAHSVMPEIRVTAASMWWWLFQ
jgi:hypothetical protein